MEKILMVFVLLFIGFVEFFLIFKMGRGADRLFRKFFKKDRPERQIWEQDENARRGSEKP
jgi:hypothetical protein